MSLVRIRRFPKELARIVSWTARSAPRRDAPVSFLVIFVRRDDEPLVMAISHTRRRPLYWIERLGQAGPH